MWGGALAALSVPAAEQGVDKGVEHRRALEVQFLAPDGGRPGSRAEKAVIFFGWAFFLISLGAPRTPAPWGVRVEGQPKSN